MPEFLHKIHAIEDSDGITQEIVPLGLQNNGYTATLPTLSADATLLTSNALTGYEPIIILQDNGSTTAGTWLAKTDAITALAEGQIFLYEVHIAGASTTTLNITCSGTAAGAKHIYRYSTTKLTTHYVVGEYILLYYDGTYFKVLNDYDANSDSKVRQYQQGGTGTLTGNKFPLLAKYVNTATTSYVASYANYWNDTYLDTDTGELYVNNERVATVGDIPTVNNATLTIQKNGTTVNTFTANASTNVTANITVPTTLDDISDGSTRKLSNYLPRSGGSGSPLTAPVYVDHADLTFIGTKGAFGFRATNPSVSSKHLGQVNISKNFGGDGSQYGVQMSGLDITNNVYNQFRVYQSGIAYQQYNNVSGATTNIFTVDTTGMLQTLSDIYEGGTAEANKLSNKYLGKTAKAADSDKLDGNDSTYYLNYNNLTNKPTIPTVNNGVLTIQKNGTNVQTFTANQSNNVTANITVPVNLSDISNRNQSYIDWGGPNLVGNVSPLEVASIDDLGHNKFAFMSAASIVIQYSRDGGSTWIDYGADDATKRRLVTLSSTLYIGNRTGSNTVDDRLRIILNANIAGGNIYCNLRRLLIFLSTEGSGGCQVTVEHRTIGNYSSGSDTWNTVGTYNVSGWSGWNSIPFSGPFGGNSSQTNQTAQIRLTFSVTSVRDSHSNLTIYSIRGIAFPLWQSPSTMASTGHLYSYDINQNASFPANVSASSFIEGGTTLSNKYLGKSAKAADSDKLDGYDSSHFQTTLVSGTNIKTINGQSILGSGNLEITVYDYATKAEIDEIFS